jgi:hypothetical protein
VITILVSSTNGAGIEAEYLLGGGKFIDMQAIRSKWGALRNVVFKFLPL